MFRDVPVPEQNQMRSLRIKMARWRDPWEDEWNRTCVPSSYITLLSDSSISRLRSWSCKSFSNFSIINAANRGGSVSAKFRSLGSLSVLWGEKKEWIAWNICDIFYSRINTGPQVLSIFDRTSHPLEELCTLRTQKLYWYWSIKTLSYTPHLDAN